MIIAGLFLMLAGAIGVMAAEPIKLIVNGGQVSAWPAPEMREDRVFVPIRLVAEALGAQVSWDTENRAVIINQGGQGERYLKGQNDPLSKEQGSANNFISAQELKDILDDDLDSDLADYRKGHNGGDQINNDPLIIDLRTKEDYDEGHIPTALWIDTAENLAGAQNRETLKNMLDTHVQQEGENEIVLYCATGHTAGLVCGVLGALGFNVKNLRYGYEIAWAGTRKADPPIRASIEDKDGYTRTCGG